MPFPIFIATPLLKVPILLGFATCAYPAMSPTAPVQRPKERRPSALERFHRTSTFKMASGILDRTIVCGLAIVEAAILLAQRSSSTSLYRRTIANVVPFVNIDQLALRFTAASTAGCLLGLAGALLRMSSQRTLGRFFVWESVIQQEHKLVTTGPYSVVRHPGYTGSILLVSGVVLLLSGSGSLYVEAGLWNTVLGKGVGAVVIGHMALVVAGLVYGARGEDDMLREEFGEQWEEWAKTTPYRVIPYIY